jgi:hypothetical protein
MMMKCISREEDIQLLQDIHSGVYRLHSSRRSIIGKAFRHDWSCIVIFFLILILNI